VPFSGNPNTRSARTARPLVATTLLTTFFSRQRPEWRLSLRAGQGAQGTAAKNAREGDVSTDCRDERAYIFVWLGMFILVTSTGWGIVAAAPLALAASRIFEPHVGPTFVFVGVVVAVCALLTTVLSRRSGSNSGVATGCLFSVALFSGGVVVAIPTFAISGSF
jgi:hypothetical protein